MGCTIYVRGGRNMFRGSDEQWPREMQDSYTIDKESAQKISKEENRNVYEILMNDFEWADYQIIAAEYDEYNDDIDFWDWYAEVKAEYHQPLSED
jgi:hypothetical protein